MQWRPLQDWSTVREKVFRMTACLSFVHLCVKLKIISTRCIIFACNVREFSHSSRKRERSGIRISFMEECIVIPTKQSVQSALQKEAAPTELLAVISDTGGSSTNGHAGESENSGPKERTSVEATVSDKKLALWQNNRKRQSTLLKALEVLLEADLEALKAGKPPPG